MDGTFYISTDRSKMDIPYIHRYLSNKSYWAKGRTLDRVKKSLKNSVCFGVFNRDGKQLGFARIVTDYVVFAWLMDIFIDETLRGQGVGKLLMDYIVNYPNLMDVNGMGLRTKDAHSLYEKFGFEKIDDLEDWMLRKNI